MTTLSISPTYVPAQPMTQPRVRLTRRGRLALFLGSLLMILATGVFLGASSLASNLSAAETSTVVVVGHGETLWSIADEAAGDGSTTEMMAEIREINRLDSSTLYAGQRLLVPTD